MIINNKRVPGLYIYNSDSENIEFTKNDLVVSGGYIYICDADIVSGIDPADDTSYDYYRPYPGSKIMSASEYFQWVKDGGSSGGSKYISAQSLMGILQGYQFGLNMEGVITDWIDQNGDTTLILSNITERPVDNLMLTETLNRGMVKIDWRLKQIIEGEVNGESFSTLFGFLDRKDPNTGETIDYQLILSQYTYKQSESLYIRIQELMSPLSGVSIYRYMSWSEGEFPSNGSTISSWRNVFSYSTAIQSKLNALEEYYETLATQLQTQVASLRGSFRFKEVYMGSNAGENNSKVVTDLSAGIYTICLEGFVEDGTYTESMTVQLKSGMSSYKISPTKLTGKIKLSFSDTGTIEITDDGGNVTKFISIYKREERV